MPQMQEVQQMGPKTVSLWSDAQPVLLEGYKRPSENSRDDIALDFIQMILGDRQTGWIQKELVDGKHLAQDAEVTAAFPSGRFINLFVVSVIPAHDHTVEENRKAVDDLIARLQSQLVDAETLARVKAVLRVRAAQAMGSNDRLAAMLPLFYARYGDWRKLFAILPLYDQMTAPELQRVALQYLNPFGRTVASITGGQEQAATPLSGGQQ
jgi:predicted Zn-dependent peptidase